MPASDDGDDFVGIGDPLEGFGMGIVIFEEAIDRGLKVGDGSEDAAFEAALGEGGEEALDGVEPGGRCRREVEGPARMARDPLPHGGMLVGGVVDEDGVDGLAGGNLALDGVADGDEAAIAAVFENFRQAAFAIRRYARKATGKRLNDYIAKALPIRCI